MEWSDVSMIEAIRFATGKQVDGEARRPKESFFSSGCVVFTDGTAIECTSEVSGPYSDATPDVDWHEPSWRIFGQINLEAIDPQVKCES